MKKTIFLFTSLLLSLLLYAGDFDITQYGAVGDGKTLNTIFIQKAIDECNKSGGGKVIFPAGIYLSDTIELKDNVTLHLNKDARLLGTTDIEQYRNLDPFTEGLGIDVGWALLVAVDARNIGIEGEGAIDGQGSKLKAEHILKDTRPEGQRWGRRPFLVRMVRCDGVKVKDITLNYAAAWTSHYFQSRNIEIENVKIVSIGVAGTVENARHIVPEAIDQYPEVKTFGPTIPAYGVWARHVKGLKLKNITFRVKNNDLRPVFICEDGNDIEVSGWNIPATTGAESIIRLENVEAATISNNYVKGKGHVFIKVEGANSKLIRVTKNKTKGIKKIIDQPADLKPVVAIN